MADTQQNDEALANQAPGGGSFEFSASKPRDEPQQTSGHQPGKLVGNDAAPEFTVETLPAGTAPADRTFEPNLTEDTAPTNPNGEAAASDTLGGATSADVHTGIGHPGQGQSSAELHDNRAPGGGIEGRGGTADQTEKTN